jgi:hypothetical protein
VIRVAVEALSRRSRGNAALEGCNSGRATEGRDWTRRRDKTKCTPRCAVSSPFSSALKTVQNSSGVLGCLSTLTSAELAAALRLSFAAKRSKRLLSNWDSFSARLASCAQSIDFRQKWSNLTSWLNAGVETTCTHNGSTHQGRGRGTQVDFHRAGCAFRRYPSEPPCHAAWQVTRMQAKRGNLTATTQVWPSDCQRDRRRVRSR